MTNAANLERAIALPLIDGTTLEVLHSELQGFETLWRAEDGSRALRVFVSIGGIERVVTSTASFEELCAFCDYSDVPAFDDGLADEIEDDIPASPCVARPFAFP